MNLSWDTFAATVLALLFAGLQLVQDRTRLEWPDWTTRDGVAFKGEMRDFDWTSKSLVLSSDSDASQVRVPAENLDFWSKLRMLSSAPFHDRMSHHLTELGQNPGYSSGVQRLQRLGMLLVSAYVSLFCTLNLLLAGWILRNGSILRWLEGGAAFVVLTALSAALVMVCLRQGGDHQMLEYVVFAAALHTVLYVLVVWAIYRAGPVRSLLFYITSWMLAMVLPLSLGGAMLVAQVQRHMGSVDWPACDRYLTEVWLRPMGLL